MKYAEDLTVVVIERKKINLKFMSKVKPIQIVKCNNYLGYTLCENNHLIKYVKAQVGKTNMH